MRLLCTIFLMFMLLLNGCSHNTENGENNQIKPIDKDQGVSLIVATDLHYYAKSLTDNGSLFNEYIGSGDGKLISYTSDITDALISEVIQAKPSAFILSGDLTFNGEKVSHQELSQKLEAVEKSGIPVLVIPGNHDIFSAHAYRFTDNQAYTAGNISPEDFRQFYDNMGYKEAIDMDKSSLSYLYAVSDRVWILMIDANQNKGYATGTGSLSGETLDWIKECLEKAKEEKITVISVTHQNLLPHNPNFTDAFTIENGEELTQLLEEYQVKLNLSGHMHIQHINRSMSENGIYDIATNSLAVSPNQYGIIQISKDNKITYQSKSIDMREFAEKQKLMDPNLLDFYVYSKQYFYNVNYQKVYDSLAESKVSKTDRERMTAFATRVNQNYFSGTVYQTIDKDLESEEYKLWIENGKDTFFYTYLKSILTKDSKDENTLVIPPKDI